MVPKLFCQCYYLHILQSVILFSLIAYSECFSTTADYCTSHAFSTRTQKRQTKNHVLFESQPNEIEIDILEMQKQIKIITQNLWEGEIIQSSSFRESQESDKRLLYFTEGEKDIPEGMTFSERAMYFQQEAEKGCPKAQHSLGLLYWNGFANVKVNEKKSAKFHAAAALQNHLDAIAVLGGCIRTGTGIKKDVTLGLKMIEFCALQNNPSGVNKKCRLLEDNDNESDAFRLYKENYELGRVNALLLFNLGWCYMNGQGVHKNTEEGIKMWEKAAALAPDEGAEEASWYLYEHYKRDLPVESEKWISVAADLGFEEAIQERLHFDKW